MKRDMNPPKELVKGPIKSSELILILLNIFKAKNKKKPETTEDVAVVAADTTIIKTARQNFKEILLSNNHDKKQDIIPAISPAVIDWNITKFKLPNQIFLRPLILSITPIRDAFESRLVKPDSRIPLKLKITGIKTNNSGTFVKTFQV